MKDVDILEYLFGSKVSARLLKFFFRHPQEAFRVGEIARLINSNYNTAHSYIKKFETVGLIKPMKPAKPNVPADYEFVNAETEAAAEVKKDEDDDAGKLYVLNQSFRLFEQLKSLISAASPIAETEVTETLNKLGKVRLALLSGVFVGKDNVPIDLFVVADDVIKEQFEAFVVELESEVGRPIKYTLMDTNEFTYRFNIYDRFVRNIFKYPHQKLIDSLSLTRQ